MEGSLSPTTPSMQAADAVEEIFRNLGIDHLISTVQDTLKLKNLLLLKVVTPKEFEHVLKVVDNTAEKRALLLAFQQVTGTMPEVKLEAAEMEIREAIKGAGLDDNVWVQKIKEGFKLEHVEQIKSVTEEQVEVFLKPISTPIQSVLVKLFEKVTEIDTAKLNIPEKPRAQRSDTTAAEAVRSVQGGVLCQGILFSEDVNELVQEREMVIDVSETLEFKETRSVHEIFRNEFTCKETMQNFVNHLDKNLSERSASLGVNIWGVSFDTDGSNCQKGPPMSELENYLSSVHYQRIPIETIDIRPNQIQLKPEVIAALQHVEKSLKKFDYGPNDHFKDFFKIYGSHINQGTIEFGGTLVSVAYCEGFREEDRKRVTDAVIEVSEAALLLDVFKKVRPGTPFNAFEVFGRTTRINAEDLKNITVVVKNFGGSPIAEKDNWKQGLRDNCKVWEVIQRVSQPKPMWKILQQHKDEFKNYLRIASAMQEEWKRKSWKKESRDDVLIPEKEKLEDGNASNKQKPEHERVSEKKHEHLNDLDTQKQKYTDSEEKVAPADVNVREKGKPEDAGNSEEDQLEDAGVSGNEGPVQTNTSDKLANVSREVEEMKLLKSKISEEDKQRNALRSDIRLWIDRYRNLNQQTVDDGMKSLVSLRKNYDSIGKEWQSEIIYLRDVQTNLLWTGNFMKKTSTNPNQKVQLAEAVNHILFPLEEIRCDHFPNFRQLTESLKEADGIICSQPFTMESMRQLPDILKECENIHRNHPELDLKTIQERLENTVRALMETPVKIYEHLMILGSLRLLGFNFETFLFDHILVEEDLGIAVELLEAGFQFLDSSSKAEQQAYILNLGLCSRSQRQKIIQVMRENMPGGICIELREACEKTEGLGRVNLDRLQQEVDKVLQSGPIAFDMNPLLIHALTYQFRSFHVTSKMETQRIRHETNLHDLADKKVEKLLEALEMKKYYPQKLRYEDVIMLTSSIHDDVNKKPTSLPELPWYFMKHVIGVDSDTRESCHVLCSEEDNSDSSDDDDDENRQSDTQVHPLDLIYTIFICADDFLRQELTDKMSRCQYAVPFILPPSEQDRTRSLMLHWGVKSITRNFCYKDTVMNKNLVDTEAPLVACVSLGKETYWKSKLINAMLSPQQETFWHHELKGGNCKQMVSEGMVELAWYLPGRREENVFSYPVAFANLRQSMKTRNHVCQSLCSVATTSCFFTEEVTDDVTSILKTVEDPQKIILIVLYNKGNKKIVNEKCKQLKTTLNLESHQIIRKQAGGASFNPVYEKLKKAIEHMTRSFSGISLSNYVQNVKEAGIMDVDDLNCYHGEMAARTILKDIDKCNNRNFGRAKAEILTCQYDLNTRQQMAALDKELCRQRKCGENTTVQSYVHKIKEKKWQMQLKQLRKPMSSPFKYFLQCLHSLSASDRKYFLQSLKFGLNERSVGQLQPLYEEYEKLRAADESEERDRRLKEIDEQLTHGSLGLEHFFREMAILFENALALRDKVASADNNKNLLVICKSLDRILDSLANAMMEALMDGTAIEIMDGDAVHVPSHWLSAVLNKVHGHSKSKILKMSVLGAQSCGKSTLLNTTFGLNFPVSSGRCTRGAYMQLVKVDETLKETLRCDYVAVIDSEGLMSRTKTDDSDYDNELSTFIIGLSDLTLVIIKGEGNEMNNVLPLAIHVFLRMNIVGEKQACHFVHQNMGAVDAMTKISTEIDAFVRDLNAKTLAAAKDTNQSDQYKRFTDILKYDPRNDNTYVPGLWNGTPPMGKTNADYSQTMQELKSHVITTVTNMQKEQQKGLNTFKDFAKRLQEVWNAIKHENFVLSFKNVLAVEAHKKLSRVLDQDQWTIKREIREMIQEEVNIIENTLKEGNSQRTVKQMASASLRKLTTCLEEKIAKMEVGVMHYFQCTGCKDCDNDVQNRHLLINNEKEFEDEVRAIKRSLTREMEETMENVEIKMTTDEHINRLSAEVDSILNKKVSEAIAARKSQNMDTQDIERIFSTLWREATRDIMALKYIEKDPGIEGIVQATIKNILGKDHQHYIQKRAAISPQMGKENFNVDHDHMQLKGSFLGVKKLFGYSLNEEDFLRLHLQTEEIVEETTKFYDGKYSPDGKQFFRKDVEMLFKDVQERIESIQDERFKVTKDYEMSLICYIEKRAVEGFTMMHRKYYQSNKPKSLLEKKKKSFHDLLVIKMGQGNAAAKFCGTVLKDVIVKNIEEQLSCTELLHDLRDHCGQMFRDIKSIHASIMVKMLRENDDSKYLEFITNYEKFVKFEMEKESFSHFSEEDRLKELGKTRLDQLITEILQAVEKTADCSSHDASFIKTFFQKIDHLKISHDDAAGYRKLDVADKEGFSGIIQQQLKGAVREDILKDINSWDVLLKLIMKNLTDFLFTEVVGCKARCPFCAVPCDAHSGGKTQGSHSSTMHRPRGLNGKRWYQDQKLVTPDCRLAIAAGHSFWRGGKWQCYRDYKKFHPDWIIYGDGDPDVEKYWKWVFAQHNEKFAEYYSCEPADIPPEWGKYTNNDIKKDIEDNYHVQVDI